MRLSFEDEESFKEAAGSLHFNNPPLKSDPDSLQQVGSSSHGSLPRLERNEDIQICFDNPPASLSDKKNIQEYITSQ